MKGFLVSSLLLSLVAVSAQATPSDVEQEMVRACSRMSVLAVETINDHTKNGMAKNVRENLYVLSAELSKHLPQTYTPIQTGLNEALQLKGTDSSASLADRAAVIGMWCIQDTAEVISNGDARQPILFEQDTQVLLINGIADFLGEHIKTMDSIDDQSGK